MSTEQKTKYFNIQFSCSVMSDFLQPHELQYARPPCLLPTPGVYSKTHVHWVSNASQPSHPLSSPSPPAFNLSQHQGLFLWVSFSHQVAKVLEFQLQHQSLEWIFRTDFLHYKTTNTKDKKVFNTRMKTTKGNIRNIQEFHRGKNFPKWRKNCCTPQGMTKKKEKGIWYSLRKNGKLEHKSRIMKENFLGIQPEKASHWEKKHKTSLTNLGWRWGECS